MIPRNVIDSLKCSSCKNILSVFPVYSYGSRETVICGRCSVQNDFLPQRQDLYEELAQHIEFSCQYQNNGCVEKLRPVAMKNHEEHCIHKPCFCPILPLGSCPWQGGHNELFDHYEDCHPTLSHTDFLIEIDVGHSFEENYVFYQANQTFVAQLKFDVQDGIFYCNVRYCGSASDAQKFSYRACFLSKKRKYSCMVQSVEHGEIGPVNTRNATIATVVDIVTNLNYNVCSSFKIDIFVKKVPIEENKEPVNADNHILKMLECPICLDYMVPPIMQCSKGHSFCQECRNKVAICPTCKGVIEETRNFLLEQITNAIDYPCKYERFGCTFLANAERIKAHESSCQNGPIKCIIDDCPWENKSSELKEHLNVFHKDNILETNSVTYILDDLIDAYEYIIMQYDNIFKVNFSRSGNEFLWHLEIVDETKHPTNTYLFLLDFGSQMNEKLYIQTKCDPYQLTFSKEQLNNFIDDDILMYKMQVFQDV